MKKFSIESILSLCVLLVGGSGPVHANPFNDGTVDAYSTTLAKSENACVGAVQSTQAFSIKSAASGRQEGSAEVNEAEIENEEDESNSSKKHSQIAPCFTAFLSNPISAYSFHSIKESLPFGTQLSCIVSPRWYLVLRMFRI